MKKTTALAFALALPVGAALLSGTHSVASPGTTSTTMVAASAATQPAGAPDVAEAPGSSSTTTTTTIPGPPTSTTLVSPNDVSAGGRFRGGFGAGSFDLWYFEFSGAPVVLVLETSDGIDQCDGDTTLQLLLGGVPLAFDDQSGPARCSRIEYPLASPGTYDIRVAGAGGSAVREYVLDVEFVETDCGNGLVELLEQCDDGNADDDDCCLSNCKKAADASPCTDGLACNGADTCAGGLCIVHASNPCAGVDGDANCAESCSDTGPGCSNPDPDGSPCNNGLFCDGPDRCLAGSCLVHAGDPCRGPDGDGNCLESCKESSDSCTAADPGTPVCDDGKWCNGDDTCFGGLCNQHTGNPCPGADGDADCTESCSETNDRCSAADPFDSPCNDGLFCTIAESCIAGVCAGDPRCPGPDGDNNCAESCDEAAQTCTAPDANGSACSDGLFCNGADSCSSGACSLHAGDPCPGPDGDGNCAETCSEAVDSCTGADTNGTPCNDGVFCNGADTCSGGTCSVHAGNPCPGPDGDGNCSESCNETADTCTAPDANGSACSDGLFCNGADTCSGGACSVRAGNPCPGPDGDGNCSESCNEATDACTAPDTNGSACNDGLFCTVGDNCAAGACTASTGGPCPGADGDGNCSESCNEATDACTAPDANGSACNDGLFCNGADTCSGGACSVNAGNPCPGADGDGNCSESCSEAADACVAADPNGSACSDGLYCNGADTCAGGACATHVGSPCPGPDGDGNCSESCNEATDACTAADPNGSACNDGSFCDGADTCSGGACSVSAGNPCPGPDGDSNCAEACDETSDTCTAAEPNGSACNDGTFCNGADTCSAGACGVHAGNPCTGADGDGNCAESCSEANDNCAGADPDGSTCNDGLLCNGADTCSGGACALHGSNPCAGVDGDSNCAESCSDSAGGCNGQDPNGSPCDDGVYCNGADRCSNGTCSVHLGNPCAGADGDDNCAESCNETSDTCTAPDPNGSPCSDGVFCNGADTCAAGACSVHAGNPCPGPDGDGNCAESCNEGADACSAADPNGSACTDGLFCNGADTCAGGTCSVNAGNPCAGPDGDGNCSESCSEASDSCSAADPNGSTCNDGLYCNGADECSGGACGLHEGSPCAGADGDANCSESCSEATDTCAAADPNGSPCDDGLYCNGADTCAAGACSAHAGSPCQGADGDANCVESCSEAADACNAADPNGSACNDGLYCNGADTCAGGACSAHAGDPCPGADGDGDCSETCNEAAAACTAADDTGSACDDGNACSHADACTAGAVCQGAVVDCDDDDPCTTDQCIASEPFCSHTAIPNCPASGCGDLNDNGQVSASDALGILQAAVGGSQCLGKTCVCDTNGNGSLTASDALLVLRFAVGQPTSLECPC